MDLDTFLDISDRILAWLEKQAQAKKKEKAASEATTNEPVKKEEAGSPGPSLPSTVNETPKEGKVPATPQEETRPTNEPAKSLEGVSLEGSPGTTADLTDSQRSSILEKEEQAPKRNESTLQADDKSPAQEDGLRREIEKILRSPVPIEPTYLGLIKKTREKWERYLREEVRLEPLEFRFLDTQERLEIEKYYVEWLRRLQDVAGEQPFDVRA